MYDLLGPLFLAVVVLGLTLQRIRKPSRLPPGPPPGLLGDNTSDVPVLQPWKTFKGWGLIFGPVISLYLGRTPIIILGTAEAAKDLLEKRGEIYSSRPRSIMGNEILSGGLRGIGMPYGPRWRRWRSLQQSALSIQASAQYQRLQEIESLILLNHFLVERDPAAHPLHLKRFAVSIVFSISYGRRIKTLQDELVLANQKTDGYFGRVHVPGKYLVESWPILLYLPRFLQWFRYEPDRHRALDTELYMSAMNDVKDRMKLGTAQPSMATHALRYQEKFGLSDIETAYALAAPWAAGVGTTLSVIEVGILAMLLHPSVMRKVQAELDSVVGKERLPGFQDRDSLPYMQAVIKEILRWRPIAPTGFPHSVTENDTYQGMFIPKGSTVYANIYAIMSDPSLFPAPDEFSPERFLQSTESSMMTAHTMSFGFGRRICPGMHVAMQSVFIVLVRMMWAFDIVAPVDENGKELLPSSTDFTSGLISRPANLKYKLVPRTSSVGELIALEAESAEMEATRWD